MSTKAVVKSVLLLVLGASVLTWAVKSLGPAKPEASRAPGAEATAPQESAAAKAGEDGESRAGAADATAVLADGIAVINFHGTKR